MKAFLARALVCAFPCLAMAQIAVLQIKVIDGEGAVLAPGAHVIHPLTVELTNENGQPVSGATVSFQLPPTGPGGLFPNGLRTDVSTTGANGRASIPAVRLNQIEGEFRIRITAVKEQARAGIVSIQRIGGSSVASAPAPAAGPVVRSAEITRTTVKMGSGSHKKWFVLAAVAVAGGVAVLVATRAAKSSQNSTVSASTASVGTPTLTVGNP
jgi:hypothetical protein